MYTGMESGESFQRPGSSYGEGVRVDDGASDEVEYENCDLECGTPEAQPES